MPRSPDRQVAPPGSSIRSGGWRAFYFAPPRLAALSRLAAAFITRRVTKLGVLRVESTGVAGAIRSKAFPSDCAPFVAKYLQMEQGALNPLTQKPHYARPKCVYDAIRGRGAEGWQIENLCCRVLSR
jgi:hypothetical protein